MHSSRWLLLMVCLAWPWAAASAQHRPLRTDDAEILETGMVRTEFGVEFLQGQRYSLSGLRGDLMRMGVVAVDVGVGEFAEFQLSGVVQDFLSVKERTVPVVPADFSGNSTSDFGNLALGTKLRLAGEKGPRPAVAFKFAVELPNANQGSGLGTDEMAFYSSLLFKKRLGPSQILGEVGFAILGSPVTAGGQTDPLTYGVAAVLPVHRRVNLVAGISGREGPSGRVGNENKSEARAGIQFATGGLRWDVGGVAGLKRFDPKSGIVVGVTYEFRAFKRDPRPVTIQ